MTAQELRKQRRKKYLTLKEVADKLTCTQQYISLIELGKRPIPDHLREPWEKLLR